MTDFSKVHGPDHDPAKLYREENVQLKAMLAQVQGEVINRAMPRIGEMIDAIENVTRGTNMGNAQAKDILRRFYAALDAGRDATSKLTVVRNGGGSPSPS